MRPLDLATLLAILAAVVLIVAPRRRRAVCRVPGPLTVDEATTFFLDTPVVVSGYLVEGGARTYLCDAPRCPGVRLAVVGLAAAARPRRVLVAGVVTGTRSRFFACRTPGAPERSEPPDCS